MSIQFKDPSKMLPSEATAYIEDLHNEIKRQNELLKAAGSPDTFIISGQDEFKTESDLLASMELGEVVETHSFKRFGHGFKVKLDDQRIDEYPTRIEAEHVAMLHNVKV
jgi:hypothetical protein